MSERATDEQLAARLCAPGASPRIGALAAHLRVPLERDGYALAFNSVLAALLGVAYWLVAARNYTPRVVGVNTAAISAMMFLAGLSQLNLMSALVRFVPVLGPRQGRFIGASYAVAALAGAISAAIFLIGIHLWAPALATFGSTGGMVAWFLAGSVAWCVFNLQDSALTGLGAAVLVPLDNLVYGVVKIVLLVAFVSVSPQFGIFASWTAGLIVSLVLVNSLIFGRLLRRRHRAAPAGQRPGRSEIVGFIVPDYVGAVLWLAATTLMPVIVIAVAGAAANAYFSLDWMITAPLLAISAGTGVALVATAAADPGRVPEYARRVLLQTTRLVVPAAAAVAIASPYLLRVFGHQYASHGALTLSLLALSAIPGMITALYVSIYRAQRRMRAVVTLLAALCGSVLALGTVLLVNIGIEGAGLAWLIAQSAVAAVVLSVDPGALRNDARNVVDLLHGSPLMDRLRAARARRYGRRHAAQLSRCVPPGMILVRVEATVGDVAVGHARAESGGSGSAIIKLASSPSGGAALRRAASQLEALAADPRLAGWRVRRPELVKLGELDGRTYAIESELSGISGANALERGAALRPLSARAFEAIAGLHRPTAEALTVDAELLARWVGAPVRTIAPVLGGSARRVAVLAELERELRARLDGMSVTAALVHGDFVPGNVLMSGPDGDVSGIVDWELASAPDLPGIDTMTFLLAGHAQLAAQELGQTIARAVPGDADDSLLDALSAGMPPDTEESLDLRSLVLLCWLRHAAGTLRKSERYARHPIWRRYNVELVLDAWGGG